MHHLNWLTTHRAAAYTGAHLAPLHEIDIAAQLSLGARALTLELHYIRQVRLLLWLLFIVLACVSVVVSAAAAAAALVLLSSEERRPKRVMWSLAVAISLFLNSLSLLLLLFIFTFFAVECERKWRSARLPRSSLGCAGGSLRTDRLGSL